MIIPGDRALEKEINHPEKDARSLCRERITGVTQGMTKLQVKVFLSSGD